MKKGIHYWALPTDMDLKQKFQFARSCGFEGVELVILRNGDLAFDATDEQLRTIRDIAVSEGMMIPSLTNSINWTCSMTSADKKVRQKAVDVLKREIDIANTLGVEAVLALPGFVSMSFSVNGLHPAVDTFELDSYHPSLETVSYDLAFERALKGFKEISKYAEDANVLVCVENIWSNFLLSPLEMRFFIDSIGSPFVASYFDVGNVRPYGIPQHWIGILGEKIRRVHLKDYTDGSLSVDSFVNLGTGNLDFRAISDALVSIGYDGWVVAEVNVDPCKPEYVAHAAYLIMDKFF